jgi:hypothetical protein
MGNKQAGSRNSAQEATYRGEKILSRYEEHIKEHSYRIK